MPPQVSPSLAGWCTGHGKTKRDPSGSMGLRSLSFWVAPSRHFNCNFPRALRDSLEGWVHCLPLGRVTLEHPFPLSPPRLLLMQNYLLLEKRKGRGQMAIHVCPGRGLQKTLLSNPMSVLLPGPMGSTSLSPPSCRVPTTRTVDAH